MILQIQKSKQPGESLEADSKEDSEDLCYSQAGQAPQSQQSMLKPKRQALSSAKQSTPEMSAKKGLPKKNGVSNSQLTAFAVVSPEAVSSGSRGANPGNTSGPTRPTPRHFKDLPASLAFEPLGREKAGPLNIVGRMATSAAVQNRFPSSLFHLYSILLMTFRYSQILDIQKPTHTACPGFHVSKDQRSKSIFPFYSAHPF